MPERPASAVRQPVRPRALDAVPAQRLRHEAARLRLLDERSQPTLQGEAALRHRHRLLDDHEAARQQAHAAADAHRVRLQLLLDAGRDLEPLGEEEVGHRRRDGRAHERRRLQLAREEEVVGAAPTDGDARARAVDVLVPLQGRVGADEVGALDDDVRRGVVHVGGTHGIDRDEGDVDPALLDRFGDLAGRLERHELGREAEPPRRLPRQVDRQAARLSGGAAAREDRVAEVDGGAETAGRAEVGGDGGRVDTGTRALRAGATAQRQRSAGAQPAAHRVGHGVGPRLGHRGAPVSSPRCTHRRRRTAWSARTAARAPACGPPWRTPRSCCPDGPCPRRCRPRWRATR